MDMSPEEMEQKERMVVGQCICMGCPVDPMMDLTEWYFCTRGSEKAQKGG